MLLDAAHREGGIVLLLAIEVDAVVLSGIGRGRRPLDAQPRSLADEVVLLAEARVEVDVHRYLKLLRIGLIDEGDIAHDAQHALTLTAQLVEGDSSVVAEDIVALVERHDLSSIRAGSYVVAEHLVVGECAAIESYGTKAYVGMLAGHVDGLGRNLQEGIRLPVAHRTRSDAIDVNLEEATP